MKKIIVLNGAARKNGNTAKLVEAFVDGAESAGNQVKTFYLDGMDIHSCKGCLRAGRDYKSPCSQKDDMDQIYAEFEGADVSTELTAPSFKVLIIAFKIYVLGLI